jgi:hypothetical protein
MRTTWSEPSFNIATHLSSAAAAATAVLLAAGSVAATFVVSSLFSIFSRITLRVNSKSSSLLFAKSKCNGRCDDDTNAAVHLLGGVTTTKAVVVVVVLANIIRQHTRNANVDWMEIIFKGFVQTFDVDI